MFNSYPTYPRYRTLHLTSPNQRGEDVYALQTAINALALGTPLAIDGVLGPATSNAISKAQKELGITVDGLAGGGTQQALARRISLPISTVYKVPLALVRGQMEHESSFRLGNYSAQYPDGSYDMGVVQENTHFSAPNDAFDVPKAIEAICKRTELYYEKFAGVQDTRRRRALAAAAWNAPAFACYIAREEGAKVDANETLKPSASQRAALEDYMASVTVYL